MALFTPYKKPIFEPASLRNEYSACEKKTPEYSGVFSRSGEENIGFLRRLILDLATDDAKQESTLFTLIFIIWVNNYGKISDSIFKGK